MAHKIGQQVAGDHAARARAQQERGGCEILLAQSQQLGAYGTRQARPVDQAENHGNSEKHTNRAPGDRQRRRQRHPQRYLGERTDNLDKTLYNVVHRTTVIARQATQRDPEHEADGDADKTYRKRDPRTVYDTRENIAA